MNTARPKRPVVSFVIMVLISLCIFGLSKVTLPNLNLISDYGTWAGKVAEGSFLANFAYFLSDFADPAFQKTALGGLLLIVGAIIALYCRKKNTFGVSYGSGKFWAILASQIISSAGSILLYHHIFESGAGYVPTFIAIVAFPPAIVLIYGTEWYKVLTAGILGIFLACPFGYYINEHFSSVWGLPGVISWLTPMIVSGFISLEVVRYLPWMNRQESDPPAQEKPASDKPVRGIPNPGEMDGKWFIRRVFADFSEPMYFGNEIAGLLFIVGGLISCFLNPGNPGYGNANVYLAILASQILASAIGIFLYWHRWYETGYYNTFAPIVSLPPAFVLVFGASLHVVLVGALLGAVFMPPVAEQIGAKLAKRYHAYLGNVVSMWVCTFTFIAIFSFVPGFGA